MGFSIRSAATGWTLLVALASQVAAQQVQSGEPLTRVESEVEVDVELKDAWGRFDPEAWTQALRDPDLAKREAAFEGLVDRASCDPAVEGWLRASAESTFDPELAWLARLALRELTQGCVRINRDRPAQVFGSSAFGIDGHWLDEIQDLSRRCRRLIGETGSEVNLVPGAIFLLAETFPPAGKLDGGSVGESPALPSQVGATHVRKLAIRSRGGQRVELRVTLEGTSMGEQVYEAGNLSELIHEFPGLIDELGLSELKAGAGNARVARFSAERAGPAARGLRTDVLGVMVAKVRAERGAELGLAPGFGLAVERVVPTTLAHFFGLQPGDVLVHLNGQALSDPEDLTRVMLERDPQTMLSVDWFDTRGGARTCHWSSVEAVTTTTAPTPAPPAKPQ